MTPKVILVDDSPTILLLCQAQMEAQMEVDVSAFGNVEDALAALASDDFDLMVADMMMRNNGCTLIQAVKARNPGLPVLAISGSLDEIENAQECGADEVLPKPFSASQFTRVVRGLLSGRVRDASTLILKADVVRALTPEARRGCATAHAGVDEVVRRQTTGRRKLDA